MKTKLTVLLITLFFGLSARIGAQNIITVAGNGSACPTVDGVLAIAACVTPIGLALDDTGNIYFTDMDAYLNKVDLTGVVHRIAGNGVWAYTGDGGLAIDAAINLTTPAVDKNGDIYLLGQCTIRKIDAITGIIQTIAGTGIVGFSGDGGPATAARLNYFRDMSVDKSRHIIYLSDSSRIRKIDATGIITTIAGGPITGFTGDGGPASAALLNNPTGLSIDRFGNIYDVEETRVRKIDTFGIITTIGGNGIRGFSGDGGMATDAEIDGSGCAIDSFGNLYFQVSGQRVRKISPDGIITTAAGTGYQDSTTHDGLTEYFGGYNGDGIPATSAELNNPGWVATNKDGTLFIVDMRNSIIRKVCNCTVNSVAQIAEMKDVIISPNPNNGNFTITLPYAKSSAIITMSDLLGKVVTIKSLPFRDNINETFDLTNLPPATYLIRVEAGGRIYRDKVVIW